MSTRDPQCRCFKRILGRRLLTDVSRCALHGDPGDPQGRVLVCTQPNGSVLPCFIDRHTQHVYALLANGVNTQVTLTKDDGAKFTYQLIRPRGTR